MSSTPSPEFRQRAIYLVDASSYIFRAYYAVAPLSAPDGTPTNATYGFLQMIQALLDLHGVERCALVWDRRGKGFRDEIFPAYKANRSEPPPDLGLQLENAKEGARRLGFPQLDAAGFEADDVLATLVRRFPEQEFVIVTADKDLLQLVGPRVWCLDTLKKKWSNREEAIEKFGVEPGLIDQVQAICGDPVDNIPGVSGIGPKGAAELIVRFGNLENVLREAKRRYEENPDFKPAEKGDPLKGKKLEALVRDAANAELSLKLVGLRGDAPVDAGLEDLRRAPVDADAFREWARGLGFGRNIERMIPALQAETIATDGAGVASVDPTPAASDRFRFVTIESVEALAALFAEKVHAPYVALDTETRSLDARAEDGLVGLSLAFDAETGYYVPLRHDGAANLPLAPVLRTLGEALAQRPERPVVFQNAKFDLHVLATAGFELPGAIRIEDTMVESFVLDPTQAHGMDALAKRWLDYEPLAFEAALGEREHFGQVPVDLATRYAAEDAVVTWALHEKLAAALAEAKLDAIYALLDRPLVPILRRMEATGIRLDAEPLRRTSEDLHRELEGLEAKALESLRDSGVEVPEAFNFGSPKQIGVMLFEKLKLPVIKKTKTGPSTDVSVLEELAAVHAFPRTLLEIRELSKLLSTYVDVLPTLVDARTGRLHTDYSQVVAVTGRLSSSNPNLQNIPIRTERGRKLRDAFRAAPGYSLVGIDYSQVELRILAAMSEDPELLRAFRENADIHRRTAALVLDVAEGLVTDADRRMAKTINFGIIYGQSAFGLAKTLGIPRGAAQKFIDAYFATYPRIRAYMDRVVEEAREKGAVTTLTGRRRPMPDIHSKNPALRQFAERTAINSPIQGTAADLMKAAMIAVDRRVLPRFPDARLLLQVHDELLLEIPTDQAETLKQALVATLEDPDLLAPLGVAAFGVPMRADAAIGPDWGAL